MEYVVTALALIAFGYFIYTRVTAKRPPSSGGGIVRPRPPVGVDGGRDEIED